MAQALTNRLLDAYTKQAGPTILSRFEAVSLPFKANLFRIGKRPRYVNFLTSGLSSLIALLDEGIQVEVAMSGYEGCPEAIHLLGPELPPRDCMMQVPGSALRMPIAEFSQLFEEDALMRRLVLRLIQYQNLISNQLIACNGQHDAIERLARWLLMVQDRVHDSDLPLTQEFLSRCSGQDARQSPFPPAAFNVPASSNTAEVTFGSSTATASPTPPASVTASLSSSSTISTMTTRPLDDQHASGHASDRFSR